MKQISYFIICFVCAGGSVWRPPVMNLYTAGMPDELVEEDDAKENIRGTLSNR